MSQWSGSWRRGDGQHAGRVCETVLAGPPAIRPLPASRSQKRRFSETARAVPKTSQLVEKVLAARSRTILDTAESVRQGSAAVARPAPVLLSEPRSEFFNKLERF